VLDLTDMTWRQYPQGVLGRTCVPWVVVENILYSYGGSKGGGMLRLNLDTFEIEIRATIGVEPPPTVMGAGMVRIDNHLFFFGGRSDSEWTLAYACDIRRMRWFVFHVVPDGETVSLADGIVNDAGLFMLPRIHSFGFCYEKENREVIAFLGEPERDPPPFFRMALGEALSVINLREDMIAAFKPPTDLL
jgi:hypothetical protein